MTCLRIMAGSDSNRFQPTCTTVIPHRKATGSPATSLSRTFWYDQHYPNVLAGFASTHPPNGDINESMSTLWYHDHRVDFTAQNVYKGLAGFYLLFNQFDTGNETTGFRLPTFPDFDIPMMFNDKNFDPDDGLAVLRPGEPGRHPGRQVSCQREDSAVLRGQEAPLSLPLAQRRAFALLPVLRHQTGQHEPSVLGDCQ